MTKKVKTTTQVTKGAKQETKEFLKSPSYGMRVLNRIAEGKDMKDIEGLSREDIHTLYTRSCEVSGQKQGFGWNTLIAREGMCVTSMRKVKLTDRLYFAEGKWHVGEGKRTYMCEEIDGQLYLLRTAAWSYTAIVASTGLWVRMCEARAKASKNLYTWQQARKDSKRKADKQARKQARKQAQAQAPTQVELTVSQAIELLKTRMQEGKLTSEEIAALQVA